MLNPADEGRAEVFAPDERLGLGETAGHFAWLPRFAICRIPGCVSAALSATTLALG